MPLLSEANAFLTQAVRLDSDFKYQEALDLYIKAVKYFMEWLQAEETQNSRSSFTDEVAQKTNEAITRAETIKKMLSKTHDSKHGSDTTKQEQKVPACIGAKKDSPRSETVHVEKEKQNVHQGENYAMTERPETRLCDIAGNDTAKQAIEEAILLPMRAPYLFKGKVKPWSGILLFGPPGTGKSYLAEAIAGEMKDVTYFSLTSSKIVSKYVGESEKNVATIFEQARQRAPSVVFIDEIDSMCRQRGAASENESSRRIKTEFLTQLQGVGNNNDGIIFIGATNKPEELDDAMIRRFECRVYVPLPDAETRRVLMAKGFGPELCASLTEKEWNTLVNDTDGMSGADIGQTLCKEVNYYGIRFMNEAETFIVDKHDNHWVPCHPSEIGAIKTTLSTLLAKQCKIKCAPVGFKDIMECVKSISPSVDPKIIKAYETWNKRYGYKISYKSKKPT